jgi:hypothetical protein
MSDVRDAQSNGFVSRAWHFNSVLKVIEDATVTPSLHKLITASAAPLRSVESAFAVDSTGFGTQSFYRHYSAKYGHDQFSRNLREAACADRNENERDRNGKRDRPRPQRLPRNSPDWSKLAQKTST